MELGRRIANLEQERTQQEADRNLRLGRGIASYALYKAEKGETGQVLSRASIPRFRLRIAGRPVFAESMFGRSEMYPAAAYDVANAELEEQGLVITPPAGVDSDFMVRMSIDPLESPAPNPQNRSVADSPLEQF